jgi:hypothetical protein
MFVLDCRVDQETQFFAIVADRCKQSEQAILQANGYS